MIRLFQKAFQRSSILSRLFVAVPRWLSGPRLHKQSTNVLMLAQQLTDNTLLSGGFAAFCCFFLRIDLPVIMCRKSICCCQSNIRAQLRRVHILQVLHDLSAQTQLAAMWRRKGSSFWTKCTFFKAFVSTFFFLIAQLLRFRKYWTNRWPAVIWRLKDRWSTLDQSDWRRAAAQCYCTHYSSVFTLMKLHPNSSYTRTHAHTQVFCQQVPRWRKASLFAKLSTLTEWIYNNLTSHPVHSSPAVAAVLGDTCTAPCTQDLRFH